MRGHTHTHTHAQRRSRAAPFHTTPGQWPSCLGIETDGEITQAALLNNSLHSHFSGSMLQ